MGRAGRILIPIALASVAALGAGVFPKYRRDIREARERVSAHSRIAQTSCGPIEYAVIGEGPPVLIVHGAGGGFDQGLDLGAPLAASGFRVIAMSRFGYLGTPLPDDASAAAQADAHAYLLDALNIPSAAIVGFSAGAPSSMQLAVLHPERAAALVLVVPAAFVPRAGGAPSLRSPTATQRMLTTVLRSDFLFWAAIKYAPSTLIEAVLGTPLSVVQHAGADERARIVEVLQHILPVSPRRLGLLNDATIVSSLKRCSLERMDVPALVASAVDDLYGTFDGARYTATHIPGARFVAYPDGGHLLVGHQQALMAEVIAFLRQRNPVRGPPAAVATIL